jgi:hypothetical protein
LIIIESRTNIEDTVFKEWVSVGNLMKSKVGFVFSFFASVLLVVTVFEISLVFITATVLVISFAFARAGFYSGFVGV